jgi:hypothetical protein
MNRDIAGIGVVFILLGFGLVAYPIVVFGGEQLDLEQEIGFLVAPLGLVVVMLGALAHDPERTTVGGAFGNPELAARRPDRGAHPTLEPRANRVFNPHEPVNCRYCRTVIAADLALCPRCARPRECRNCGRPLGIVMDRPTCPACARAEPFCNCPQLARPATSSSVKSSTPRRR